MRTGKKIVVIVVAAFSFPIAIAAIVYCVTSLTLVGCPDAWSQVSDGMMEPQVRSILGKPKTECNVLDRKVICALDGYKKPPDVVAARALVFLGCDKAFYVFLDSDGKVIRTWWGGS